MTKGRNKKPYYFNKPAETAILTPFTAEEAAFICEHNPTQIPYERLDFSALNEEDQKGTDEDIAYILAHVEHIKPNPDFDFAEFKKKFKKKNKLSRRRIKKICQAIDKLDEQEMELQRQRKSSKISKHAGVFEFSGTDLISADIDPKTLMFKKD